MKQLSGLDAAFLYLETANAPMHIASLGIYDPSTAADGSVTFKQILANTVARKHLVPPMNNVLVDVPLRLDHPYWITDENLDVEYHIRHMALPQPGDWRQLCILVSRLHARPLDRSRPLWEMNVIEGLDNVEGCPKGSFAIYLKIHHAAFDGASAVEMGAVLHDLTPDYNKDLGDGDVKGEKKPSDLSLIIRSQMNAVRKPGRMLSVARNTLPGVARLVGGLRRGEYTRVRNIPRTRFNGKVSPHRVVEGMSTDFENIRAIKNYFEDVTVNDVALTICGGALRKYLDAKGELPIDSLVAMAPINVRTKEQSGTHGNQVSQMTVKLGTDVADPLERLHWVNEGTRNAKQMTNAIGAKAMTDITQFIPSTLAASAAKLSSKMGLSNAIKPQFNCTVTNVPGPPVPMYFTGAELVKTYGLGPVMDGLGLFHAISSYRGQFIIAVTSCREMMPDPDFYIECVKASYAELLEAVATPNKSAKKAKKRTKAMHKAMHKVKPKATKRKKKISSKAS